MVIGAGLAGSWFGGQPVLASHYGNMVINPDDEFEESTAVFSTDALRLSRIPSPSRHVLVRLDGSDVGKVIGLDHRGEFLIGRRRDSHLALNYEGVSRRHARILFEGGSYFIEDMGSANGTMVGSRRIKRHRLVDGDVLRFGPAVSVRYSVTDAKEEDLLRHLYEAKIRDSLTGAFNREYLSERLRSELSYATRHSTQTSLIMFDLDHFKSVNDEYGHQAGDAVLVQVVQAAMSNLRAEDVLARYGGEEFAISLRGIDLESTRLLAERIRSTNDRVVLFGKHRIRVSISMGCACLADCSTAAPEALIEVADRRLYVAKSNGRNCVVAHG
jgi:two-component system, cell cycle response regulator